MCITITLMCTTISIYLFISLSLSHTHTHTHKHTHTHTNAHAHKSIRTPTHTHTHIHTYTHKHTHTAIIPPPCTVPLNVSGCRGRSCPPQTGTESLDCGQLVEMEVSAANVCLNKSRSVGGSPCPSPDHVAAPAAKSQPRH